MIPLRDRATGPRAKWTFTFEARTLYPLATTARGTDLGVGSAPGRGLVMQKYLVPILAGFAAAVVAGMLFGLLLGADFLTYFMGAFVGVFTFYILANLAGNRKVAMASVAERDRAARLEPAAGKAVLCVYREGFVGMAAGLNIAVDGKDLAQLKSPRFTCVALAPGTHTLTAAFGGLAGPQNKPASFEFQAADGSVTAVKVAIAMGALRNSLTFTPAADLEALKAKLANTQMVAAAPV